MEKSSFVRFNRGKNKGFSNITKVGRYKDENMKISFFCEFYCFYTVCTVVLLLGKNKSFFRKNSILGLFGGETASFSRWAFAMRF